MMRRHVMHMNDNSGMYSVCLFDNHVSYSTNADMLMKLHPYVKQCNYVSYKNYDSFCIVLVTF